jgi:hypothetical protein
MGAERAKTFADRLPPLVPKEEEDISHLSDEMADVLYPRRRPRPFRLGVVFESFAEQGYDRALTLARQSPVYEESGKAGSMKHRAAFDSAAADLLVELVDLVGRRPGTEILVDGKNVPYAREIWLPLFRVFAIPRA